MSKSWRIRLRAALAGVIVPVALVCGLCGPVAPVAAAEPGEGRDASIAGGFALGDGLEATIDERDGAVRFEIPAGGLRLVWDSRDASNAFGLGHGWSFGTGHLGVDGGVRVFPAGGGAYALDRSHPSGLAGVATREVAFRAEPGELQGRGGRPGGAAAPVPYAYVLRQLGGTATFFDETGDPVARVGPSARRTDWVWDRAVPRRLLATIDADGVATALDWRSDEHVCIRPGSNLGERDRGDWCVRVGAGGLAVTDPEGGRLDVSQDAAGLVSRISGVSGAHTELSWRSGDDGTARIATVRTMDGSGAELSSRHWRPTDGTPSGWPGGDDSVGVGRQPFETAVFDGATRVVSSFDEARRLKARRTEVSSGTGERVAHEQRFGYPEAPPVHAGRLERAGWPDRPTSVENGFHDVAGGERTTSAAFVHDELGRVVRRTDPDGTVTETTYDSDAAPGTAGLPPIGLPVRIVTTAPDGLVHETRHELDGAHASVIATETLTGSADEAARGELELTGRTEYAVEPDGFVSETRVFPQGGAGTPVVSRASRVIDLRRGIATTVETVAAGTIAEATTAASLDLVHGGVVRRTDEVGATVTQRFDALGRLVEHIDASGRTTTLLHETAARQGRNATIVAAPDGRHITEERDPLGRVVRRTDDLRHGRPTPGHERVIETREYVNPGTVRVTDAWGAVSTSTQDALGRVVSTTAPTGLTELTSFDEVAGTTTTSVTATGRASDADFGTTTTRDLRGRATATSGVRADGVEVPATSVRFDGLGRPVETTTSTTQGATSTTSEFDPQGNDATTTLTGVAAGASSTIVAARRFDLRGAVEQKTLIGDGDARAGRAVTFDPLGRVLTETDQDERVTSYTYSPDGLITRVGRSDGRVTSNTYDPRSRQLVRTETSSPAGAIAQAREYDPATGLLRAVWDPADPAGTIIGYERDGFGNLTRVTYPDGRTIEHEHDEHGRKTATTDAAGTTTGYSYDAAGLMTAAVQRDDDGRELARVEYEHDAFGRIVELRRGNGVTTAVSYTSASQIATERTVHAGHRLSERRYTYTPEGRLSRRTDLVDDGPAAGTTTTVYRYDAHERLIGSAMHEGADVGSPPVAQTTYRLNVSGDVVDEMSTVKRTYRYADTGALREVTTELADGTIRRAMLRFDAAGNLVERTDGTRLAYDQLDRPTRETAPDGQVRAIRYWADGTRRRIEGPSHSVTFYWDDDALVTEAFTRPGTDDGADAGLGAGAAVYLIGADRHARTTVAAAGASEPSTGAGRSASTGTRYYTHDRHGTVTELTDTTGEVTHAYSYSDYGRSTEHLRPGITSDSPVDRNPFRYAGEYTDVAGTQWLATRTYDAEHARFEQPDPTARHNRYAFGDADPITNVDPSGHVAVSDLVNGFTAAAGIVFGALAVTSAALTPGWIATVGFFGSRGFLAATGLVADVVGLGVAAVQFVDDHAKRFLPRHVKTGLTYAEYGLMGIGAVGAVAGSLPDLVREVGRRRGPPEPNIADQLDAYVKDRTDKLAALRGSETYRWYRSHFSGFERDDLVIADVGTPDIEGSSALGRDLLSFGQRSAAIRGPVGGLIANIPATWVQETTKQLTNLEQRIASARSAIVARLSVADSAGRAKGFQFTESLEHHTMVKRALFTLQEAETSYLALQDLLGLRRLTEERATTLFSEH